MDGFVTYAFRMDAWLPETLPLARLGEYATELSKLFGSEADLHLIKIRRGSAVPEIAVARTANGIVAQRLSLVGAADAPVELRKTYQKINQLLRDDSSSATLRVKGGAKLLDFPGCRTPLAEEVVIRENGDIDGVVIRVGGKDETVPVWLEGENKERLVCNATRAIAKELAAHLFGQAVRVSGAATWRRNAERIWMLDRFDIKDWQPLEDELLTTLVTRLRETPGSDWYAFDDPQAQWKRLREQR
jgi:hypothetical protein